MAVPWPTLDHYQWDSLTNLMLILHFVNFQPKGHCEPWNEVGSLSLGKCLQGFEPRTFQFYSQTCSNNQLYKMTTCLRWPVLSPPKQIPIQSLLYKMNTCLTQPASTSLSPKWKKTCLKQWLKSFTSNQMGNKYKATMHKK